jgi:hypothetical protein
MLQTLQYRLNWIQGLHTSVNRRITDWRSTPQDLRRARLIEAPTGSSGLWPTDGGRGPYRSFAAGWRKRPARRSMGGAIAGAPHGGWRIARGSSNRRRSSDGGVAWVCRRPLRESSMWDRVKRGKNILMSFAVAGAIHMGRKPTKAYFFCLSSFLCNASFLGLLGVKSFNQKASGLFGLPASTTWKLGWKPK